MTLPADYSERVYAGWLGKCIGVRFGAPLENWTYEDIRANLGELTGYVSEDQGKVFKPDDDTSVPMILIRALEDCGATPDLRAAQIAEAVLDYVGYEHGSVWWGGYGASSEHTAYLNLVTHPGPVLRHDSPKWRVPLAEQIGGQIFTNLGPGRAE
jgi:ADP-ribosylglycohydrolase